MLSGADWTEAETDNNALTKYVTIEEDGFGNQTCPRGIGGGATAPTVLNHRKQEMHRYY